MKFLPSLAVLLLVGLALAVSGCTDNTASAEPQQQQFVKNTVVCPNPDCPYHNPNAINRDIDMEVNNGFEYFLCEYCGHKW